MAIICDRDRLAQVLSNLLTNAIKYAEDGEIQVALRREASRSAKVSDQGPGIPPERAERLRAGAPFRSVDLATSPPDVGFGLYIVKGSSRRTAVVSMSLPGPKEGATLSVLLPRVAVKAMVQPDAASDDGS